MKPSATVKQDIAALKQLSESRGWQLISEAVNEDVLKAAFAFSDNPLMSEKEIDFRRGAIHASRNLLLVPMLLAQHLENELLLSEALASEFNPDATAS